MNNIRLKTFNIPNRGIVEVSITIHESYAYGYGYGGVDNDFFNIFGLLGTQQGEMVETLNEISEMGGYYYGYGNEYTSNIVGETRNKQIDVEIIPEFILDESEEFDIVVGIIGPGYSEYQILTTTDRQATFYVYDLIDSDVNLDRVFNFKTTVRDVNGNKFELDAIGGTSINNRDSFFDVTIEALNIKHKTPNIMIKNSVVSSSFYSKNIQLRADI